MNRQQRRATEVRSRKRPADIRQRAMDYLGEMIEAARGAGFTDPTKFRFTDPAQTPGKEADAAWFRAHPTRSHYARYRLPGEGFGELDLSPPAAVDVVVIRQ